MKIDGIEYDVVLHYAEDGLCYEWHDAIVLRDPSNQLFYADGSGCSCDYLEEHLMGVQDLTPVKSLHEAVELFRQGFSDSDTVEFARRLLF